MYKTVGLAAAILLVSVSMLGLPAPASACNAKCFYRMGCPTCDFALFDGTICYELPCIYCIQQNCPDPSDDPEPFPSPGLTQGQEEFTSAGACLSQPKLEESLSAAGSETAVLRIRRLETRL